MIQAVESVQREIVVPVSAERAFAVFTADMTSWWPSDHHIGDPDPLLEAIRAAGEDGCAYYAAHPEILAGEQNGSGNGMLVAAREPQQVVDQQVGRVVGAAGGGIYQMSGPDHRHIDLACNQRGNSQRRARH